MHHIKPVAQGGTNALGNLQLLCHMCHVQISEQQHLSKNPRLRSCFNPETMEIFNNAAPMPKQIQWCVGAFGEQGPLCTIWPIDINGRRRNALVLAKSLPPSSITDEPQCYGPALRGRQRGGP